MGFFLLRRTVAVLALTLLLMVPAPVLASADDVTTPSAAAIAFDATVVRPLGFAATIAGTGIFLVALPFALLTHDVDTVGERLVSEPARYTFERPLGNFEAQTPVRE